MTTKYAIELEKSDKDALEALIDDVLFDTGFWGCEEDEEWLRRVLQTLKSAPQGRAQGKPRLTRVKQGPLARMWRCCGPINGIDFTRYGSTPKAAYVFWERVNTSIGRVPS
jgi:hypothetical protein